MSCIKFAPEIQSSKRWEMNPCASHHSNPSIEHFNLQFPYNLLKWNANKADLMDFLFFDSAIDCFWINYFVQSVHRIQWIIFRCLNPYYKSNNVRPQSMNTLYTLYPILVVVGTAINPHLCGFKPFMCVSYIEMAHFWVAWWFIEIHRKLLIGFSFTTLIVSLKLSGPNEWI